METIINYMGQPAKVNCDENCDKAWGINSRPQIQLSGNEDDYAFLADDELGVAPADPGTAEGGDKKPVNKEGIPNKWCVRECERCNMSALGDYGSRLPVKSFASRVNNITSST